MDSIDYQKDTPPRLQDDSGMPTSSKNRFHFLGKLRPKLPEMLRFDKEQQQQQKKKKKKLAAYYDILDQPIFVITFFLSLQHYITTQGVSLLGPKMLAAALCVDDNNEVIPKVIGSSTFMSGVGTLAQFFIGIRLPVIETATVTGMHAEILRIRYELKPCPENGTNSTDELWKSRITQIQGTLAVGSLTAIGMGALGLVGMLQRCLTPLTLTPTITLMGASMFQSVTAPASTCWPMAVTTAVLIIMFSHYARPMQSDSESVVVKRLNEVITCLTIFPILVTIVLVWIVCFLLTDSDVFPPGHPARTDKMYAILTEASWIRIPFPFQWGFPTFHVETAIAMIFINLISTLETVCDYYACAVVAGIPPPPPRAVNRGVFTEGIGSFWSAMLGSGLYFETNDMNLGVMALTKCASIRVMKMVAGMMVLSGVVNKMSVFVTTIPDPIIGGLLLVLLATFMGVGLAHLRYVDLTSNRNVFIIGMSLVLGLIVPIQLGSFDTFSMTRIKIVDRILYTFLSTCSAVGGITGCLLDHILPGTDDERGITKLRECFSDVGVGGIGVCVRSKNLHYYDVPYLEKTARRFPFLRCFPLMPEKEVHGTYLEE